MENKFRLNLRAVTSPEEVRQFCIKHNFYTDGDNEQYGELLDYVANHVEMTTITLSVIVDDIVKHSDLSDGDWIDENDMREDVTNWFLTEACRIYLR